VIIAYSRMISPWPPVRGSSEIERIPNKSLSASRSPRLGSFVDRNSLAHPSKQQTSSQLSDPRILRASDTPNPAALCVTFDY